MRRRTTRTARSPPGVRRRRSHGPRAANKRSQRGSRGAARGRRPSEPVVERDALAEPEEGPQPALGAVFDEVVGGREERQAKPAAAATAQGRGRTWRSVKGSTTARSRAKLSRMLSVVAPRTTAWLEVSSTPKTSHVNGTRRVAEKPTRKKKIGAATRPARRHQGSPGSKRSRMVDEESEDADGLQDVRRGDGTANLGRRPDACSVSMVSWGVLLGRASCSERDLVQDQAREPRDLRVAPRAPRKTRRSSDDPNSVPRGPTSEERLQARLGAAQDEGVDVVGALVGVDRLEVLGVPRRGTLPGCRCRRACRGPCGRSRGPCRNCCA